jgi:hypothetical protein
MEKNDGNIAKQRLCLVTQNALKPLFFKVLGRFSISDLYTKALFFSSLAFFVGKLAYLRMHRLS